MAELKISSKEDFEKWLEGKPREVSITLASRTALRVFPLVGDTAHLKDFDKIIVSPTLWANTLSWVAAKHPTHDKDWDFVFATTDAASAANDASAVARTIKIAASALAANAAASAYATHRAAAYVATYAAYATRAADHATAAIAAATHTTHAAAIFWEVLTEDCRWLESKGDDATATLAAQPLWPDGVPAWIEADGMPAWIEIEWGDLVRELLEADESWQVSINWYEARLHGRPTIMAPDDIVEKLDLNIAQMDKKLWQGEPSALNAEMQRLIDEALAEAREREGEEDVGDTEIPALEALTTIGQGRLGNNWVQDDDLYRIVYDENEDDVAATRSKVTQQLHAPLRQKARDFARRCEGIEDIVGWDNFEDAISKFVALVDKPLKEIPQEIALLYDATITLASFLQYNADLKAVPVGNKSPLDPDIVRMFSDLIRTAAPWVRNFPTARELDDNTGAFLDDPKLFAPQAAVVFKSAGEHDLISAEDRDLMISLLQALEREGYQAVKAGTRSTQSAKNFVITVITTFALSAVSGNYGAKSPMIGKAGDWLVEREVQVTEFMANESPDIQEALQALFADLKDNKNKQNDDVGPRGILRRREDDR
ncbi:MAG: hypothetical protein ABJ081_04200 [Hyphomicrobiales bacterium]